nr:glycosyltransferase [Arthrobacter sp. H5]
MDGAISRPAQRSINSDRALSFPRLLYVGRIASEKGIELLLDAFALVREAIPGATLQLVGDASRSGSLRRRLRRLRPDSAVTLAGEVDPCLLHTYYDNADVFVFPSTTDTQALVLHEAAHSGLPIVTVDGQLPAVIAEGRNALVSEASAMALSRSILAMLVSCSEPEYLLDAGKTGKQLAMRYSRQRQVIEMVRLYRLVLADERNRRCM